MKLIANITVNNQAAGSASEAFFKQNTFGIVTTENNSYYITVKDWSALSTAITAYRLDEDEGDRQYIVDAQNKSSEYALLKMFGNAINLYKAPSNSTNFTPYKLNEQGTNAITHPCPN